MATTAATATTYPENNSAASAVTTSRSASSGSFEYHCSVSLVTSLGNRSTTGILDIIFGKSRRVNSSQQLKSDTCEMVHAWILATEVVHVSRYLSNP